MNEAIAKIVAATGIDDDKARKSVGAILAFLKKEGPADAVAKLMASFPDAAALVTEGESASGGLMGMAGSFGGGLMALGTKLMGMGLSMGQVQTLSRTVFAVGREYAGEDTMGELVANIPGLSQFAS